MPRGEMAFGGIVPIASNIQSLPIATVPPSVKPTIASSLQGEPVTPEFIVPDIIPKGELTLFAGQPDLGKSWLMMALMVACALDRTWLRRKVRKCRSLALFSEEPEHQLHSRLKAICQHYAAQKEDLDDFVNWYDRRVDPVIFKGKGKFSSQWSTMPTWQEIRRSVEECGIELLVLDNASTVGILYEDQHVKSFCRWLISEAEELGIAIVLLHHPPEDDKGGEKWFAGTANWRRSVRNALVLQKYRRNAADGRPWWEDDGRRVLIAPKNNYLAYDHHMRKRGIPLAWIDGALQRE